MDFIFTLMHFFKWAAVVIWSDKIIKSYVVSTYYCTIYLHLPGHIPRLVPHNNTSVHSTTEERTKHNPKAGIICDFRASDLKLGIILDFEKGPF